MPCAGVPRGAAPCREERAFYRVISGLQARNRAARDTVPRGILVGRRPSAYLSFGILCGLGYHACPATPLRGRPRGIGYRSDWENQIVILN
jgi:hypothetical protein